MPTIPREGQETPSDDPPIIRAKSDYAPSAPLGRTHTTLVGQVRGDPAPRPNTESAPPHPSQKSQLKAVNVDSGLDSPSSSPTTTKTSSAGFTASSIRSHSSSESSYVKNPKRRPKSSHVTSLPPKVPKKNRHSYHQSDQQQVEGGGDDSYSDSQNESHTTTPYMQQQNYGMVPTGGNPYVGTAHSMGSMNNLGMDRQGFAGSNHNLKAATSVGSLHDIPDRQVADDGSYENYNDRVKYADLDQKAFMIPKNQVLPPPSQKMTYAELQVSRSQIV